MSDLLTHLGVGESFSVMRLNAEYALPEKESRPLSRSGAARRHSERGRDCFSADPGHIHQAQGPKNTRRPRLGLSLLEVILALAIFGMSLAMLGELIRIGARCAAEARDLTTSQLYAESIVAEIAAGVRDASPVSEGTSLEIDAEWVYSVLVEETEQPGLVSVVVTVDRATDSRSRRAAFTLRRWIQDPGLDLSPMEDDTGTNPTDGFSNSSSTPSAGPPAGGASG